MKRILLSGGGTMGSVSPLLAVVPLLRDRGCEVRFVGTRMGPERYIIEEAGIAFSSIVAPKLRRYISLWYLFVPFQLLYGIVQSVILLIRWRPDVVVSAGGYVSVPLVWVGWVLRIPSVVHQQDVVPGLANRFMMPCAVAVTVAFEASLHSFGHLKVQWIGNPVRDLTPTTQMLHVDTSLPTVLIVGGGTGAQAINALVTLALCEIANIIHVTGKGRGVHDIVHPRYHRFEFLGEELKEALAIADVVVSRAGLGFITELIALGKPSIIIPMPQSHQEQNAALLQRNKAAVVLRQQVLTPEVFTTTIQKVLNSMPLQRKLSQHIQSLGKNDSSKQFASIIFSACK